MPNPDFPFLGVHFTRMYNGKRDVGPNAVLAFKREGYRKCDFSLRDLSEVLGYRGFWKIAGNYLGEGLAEMRRSLSRRRFAENARRLIPALQEQDIRRPGRRARSGADRRRQAGGRLPFRAGETLAARVQCPSPAATASLEIGRDRAPPPVRFLTPAEATAPVASAALDGHAAVHQHRGAGDE